jgi:hypothetical protein
VCGLNVRQVLRVVTPGVVCVLGVPHLVGVFYHFLKAVSG